MLLDPRMRIRVPVPVVPLLLSTCTPAARPRNQVGELGDRRRLGDLAASMVVTALPISSLRCSPVAVLTTSSSWTGAACMAKSSVAVAPAVTATLPRIRPVAYPEHAELVAAGRNVAERELPFAAGRLDAIGARDQDARRLERGTAVCSVTLPVIEPACAAAPSGAPRARVQRSDGCAKWSLTNARCHSDSPGRGLPCGTRYR